jgi:hypothetical protein
MNDSRFTIQKEFTGKPKAQFVVRFCNNWVDSAPTKKGATIIKNKARLDRENLLNSFEKRMA